MFLKKFLFPFFLFSLPCLSYGASLDSALIRILQQKPDSFKVLALIEKAKGNENNFHSEALFCTDIAYYQSRGIRWKRGEIEALLLKSNLLEASDNYREALQVGYRALQRSWEANQQINVVRSLRRIAHLYSV